MELKIDPEFKALIRPLSKDEYLQLETNVLKYGCRDPIVSWKGKNTIVDGHNRDEICTKHNIPFKVIEMEFADREEVKVWIIKNQFSRRNLTNQERDYLIGQMYEAEKKAVGQHKGNQYTRNLKKAQNEPIPTENTAQKIAAKLNISQATVKRAVKYYHAVEKIAQSSGEDVKAKILSGESDMAKKDIIALAQADSEELRKSINKAQKKPQQSIGEKLISQIERHEKQLTDRDLNRLNDLIERMMYKRPQDAEISTDIFADGEPKAQDEGQEVK